MSDLAFFVMSGVNLLLSLFIIRQLRIQASAIRCHQGLHNSVREFLELLSKDREFLRIVLDLPKREDRNEDA